MDVRPENRGRPSAPKTAFSCGVGGGEKLFDPGASGRKGQECPREIRTKKFMFMLFFLHVMLFGPMVYVLWGYLRFGPFQVLIFCARAPAMEPPWAQVEMLMHQQLPLP